jgi:hypothetical protein
MSKKTKTKQPTQNNVVLFPKSRSLQTELTIEQIQDNKELIRQIHIEETIETVVPFLFDNIDTMGFNLSKKPELAKEMNLVIESVNCLLRRYYEMEHPLQGVATDIFDV